MPTSDFLLLPSTLQYAKFEKAGIKNANLATLLDTGHVDSIFNNTSMKKRIIYIYWSFVQLIKVNVTLKYEKKKIIKHKQPIIMRELFLVIL